jgi:hypothetical protein
MAPVTCSVSRAYRTDNHSAATKAAEPAEAGPHERRTDPNPNTNWERGTWNRERQRASGLARDPGLELFFLLEAAGD